MYTINKSENRINKIQERTFSELGFKERKHLQEWLANDPEILEEELLIIQKEFNGFNDTNERLDLLALDKQGNLVIIENKLDDTGKDVTWQALKYASYCSTLSKAQIKDIFQQYLDKQGKNKNAEENLVEFFDNKEYKELQLNQGQTQRIIMVASNFRKEVTSSVLWLLNYKLRIQCFRVTPYTLGEQLLLDIEQIIPMKDAEEYTINMAEKTQENIDSQEELKSRHIIRFEFWKQLLKIMNNKSDLFRNISPPKENWIGTGSGIGSVSYNFVVSHYFARTEVYISRNSKEESKSIFDELFKHKDSIEENFGNQLIWERLDDKKACRIKYELNEVDIFDKEDWDKMTDFMIDGMIRLEKAFREHIKRIASKLRSKE